MSLQRAHQSPKQLHQKTEDLIFQTIFLLHLRQILSISNSFLRRNLAANTRGNKTCLGTQLREDMAAREPAEPKKQLRQRTGRSDISNYFPATSPADPVYQIFMPE
ncbi:hypothetical protein CEXT_294681 [Caerostris extrusa]|uniref:Uncharacterized protein n=1 Tax=Caerostris extrusa TaxID=172846 RepID=A0AAV4P0A1_CAEEX|nr:hypothetical protein CEXT_294681 [Caerostris extrusa]